MVADEVVSFHHMHVNFYKLAAVAMTATDNVSTTHLSSIRGGRMGDASAGTEIARECRTSW